MLLDDQLKNGQADIFVPLEFEKSLQNMVADISVCAALAYFHTVLK